MEENVIVLKDYKFTPDIVHEYNPPLKNGNIPLVIDNGMYYIYKHFFYKILYFL